MSKRIPGLKENHREVYFWYNGDPHETVCYFCGEKLTVQTGLRHEDAVKPMASCIHHLDDDHYNNEIDNLVAAHNSCHLKHHRKERPLVAKGSKIPDDWRNKVTASLKKRMSVDANRQQISKTMAARVREDENFDKPLWCDDCGAGPFIGRLGLNSHIGRGGCEKHREETKLSATYEFECSCGRLFKYARSLKRHVNNHEGHVISKLGRTPREKEKDAERETYKFQCECGRRVPSKHGLAIHKGTSCPLKDGKDE